MIFDFARTSRLEAEVAKLKAEVDVLVAKVRLLEKRLNETAPLPINSGNRFIAMTKSVVSGSLSCGEPVAVLRSDSTECWKCHTRWFGHGPCPACFPPLQREPSIGYFMSLHTCNKCGKSYEEAKPLSGQDSWTFVCGAMPSCPHCGKYPYPPWQGNSLSPSGVRSGE